LVKEIIVIDDCSRNKNTELEKQIEKLIKPVKFKAIHLKKRNHALKCRDIGCRESSGEILKIEGDDHQTNLCNIPIGVYLCKNLPSIFPSLKIGSLSGPCYLRSTVPIRTLPKKHICEISMFDITPNFDAFPVEYVQDVKCLPVQKILFPIPISDVTGNLFVKREVWKDVGGFFDSRIEGSYGGETMFALKLSKNMYSSFLCPDPRFSSIHLRVGFKSNPQTKVNEQNLFFSEQYSLSKDLLQKMIDLSTISNNSTGDRRVPSDWLYTKIRNSLSVKSRLGVFPTLVFLTNTFVRVMNGSIMTPYYTGKLDLYSRSKIALTAARNGILNLTRQ